MANCGRCCSFYGVYAQFWDTEIISRITGSAAFILGTTGNIAFVWDERGNVGIQLSYAGANLYCDFDHIFAGVSCTAGAGMYIGFYPGADTIFDLDGDGVVAGLAGSIDTFYVGGDLVFMSNGKLAGVNTNFGFGKGVDAHVYNSKTETILLSGKRRDKDTPSIKDRVLNYGRDDYGIRYYEDVKLAILSGDPDYRYIPINNFAVYKCPKYVDKYLIK